MCPRTVLRQYVTHISHIFYPTVAPSTRRSTRFFVSNPQTCLLLSSMKAEEQRLDQASRLGSAKKRKPTKAERTNRMAAAHAALERKLSKGPSVESESESEDGDKENELERANIKISGLQKNNKALRKKALYWKKNTKQLRAEVEKRAEHEVEKEEEEERLKTKREYEETLREEERLRLMEEKDSAHDELRREQKRRRVETDTYNETREQLERRIQDYQRQIHTLKAQVSRIPARLDMGMILKTITIDSDRLYNDLNELQTVITPIKQVRRLEIITLHARSIKRRISQRTIGFAAVADTQWS
ncbi:hypothetical protein F5878DRAFT_646738 [Lentinula raphanica]|uniref:Uncharacterized protein n=1 Tax=Lentinula raphanica TaxID=153919 RepID=A0AA38U5B2_9AGAR|nr:hypothetical protein F5878DRAFT_646738 [Lentinula raphanica]